VTGFPAAPTSSECLEILRCELLRARSLVGCSWASPDATPHLSGSERYQLGLLLHALHILPDYLAALASGEPNLVLAKIVEWALGDVEDARAQLGTLARRTTGASTTRASLSSPAERDFEDGPFGPAHET